MALAGFGPYQARPQQAPLVGAALVALAGDEHQQALGWATLVTSVPLGYCRGRQDSDLVLIQAPGWVHTCEGINLMKEQPKYKDGLPWP